MMLAFEGWKFDAFKHGRLTILCERGIARLHTQLQTSFLLEWAAISKRKRWLRSQRSVLFMRNFVVVLSGVFSDWGEYVISRRLAKRSSAVAQTGNHKRKR
eukprot:3566073-Rhodomonas_salina.1